LNKTLDKINDLCLATREVMFRTDATGKTSWDKLKSTGLTRDLQTFLSSFANPKFAALVRDELINVTSSLTNAISAKFGRNNWHFKPEIKLWSNTAGIPLVGKADLIAYNDDGDVVILDFKTSANSQVSTASLKDHYQ